MAQSVPPGDIQAQSNAKIVFNASYDDKHHIKVINLSARRIGWRYGDHQYEPDTVSAKIEACTIRAFQAQLSRFL